MHLILRRLPGPPFAQEVDGDGRSHVLAAGRSSRVSRQYKTKYRIRNWNGRSPSHASVKGGITSKLKRATSGPLPLVRALGSARSDLAGLDEVVEGGAGDVQYLGDGGLGDILAQQRPDVLLLGVEPGCSQGPLGRPSSFPLALAAASPSLVKTSRRLGIDLTSICWRKNL